MRARPQWRRPHGRRFLLDLLTAGSVIWLLLVTAGLPLVAFRRGPLTGLLSIALAVGLLLATGWLLALWFALRNTVRELRRSAEEIADQSAVIAINTSPTQPTDQHPTGP
jgi:HAMP domain-containing protein